MVQNAGSNFPITIIRLALGERMTTQLGYIVFHVSALTRCFSCCHLVLKLEN